MLWVYTRIKDKFDGPKLGGLIYGRRGGLDYIRNEKYLIREEKKYFNSQSVELILSCFHMIEGKFL